MEKDTKPSSLPSSIVRSIMKGFLILLPIVITWWIIVKIKQLVLGYSEPFLFYLSPQEIMLHQAWHFVGILTILMLFWVSGTLSQYKIFGKNINGWIDGFFMAIPVIKIFYGFTNQLAEALLRKIEEMENSRKNGIHKKGEPVLFDYYCTGVLQVCYKMSSQKILLYNREYKQEILHYSINVPSAGMPPNGLGVFVPCCLIDEQEEKQSTVFTMEEAIKYNTLAGSIIPERFFVKESAA